MDLRAAGFSTAEIIITAEIAKHQAAMENAQRGGDRDAESREAYVIETLRAVLARIDESA